ncbi:MAG: condensation domain-containing protein, partial [Gemmatimonadaceae bacterium]
VEHGWEQRSVPPDTAVPFARVDLSHVPADGQQAALEQAAAEWQTTLDITNGPLARVVHFELAPGRASRVLVIVHHLAVDGISWRILLEDLQQAYLAQSTGSGAALPSTSSSFADWAESLARHADSQSLAREIDYWDADAAETPSSLPVDVARPASENTEASAKVVTTALTVEETRRLLHDVPAAYRTQINDALLAALTDTISSWTGDDAILLDLEGHGRELAGDDLDMSRTVGWFTAVFPLRLDRRGRSDTGDLLKSVKEQLRAVPNHGMGYGVLRYCSGDEAVRQRLSGLPRPQMIFNYLGQFGQLLPKSSLFRLANESIGPTHDPRGERRYLLDVRAGVYADRLEIDWTYSTNVHTQATIDALAQRYLDRLRTLIDHCRSPHAGAYTPSDFPLAGLDRRELDELLSGATGVEDVYPLAPLQGGMLFHALHASGATSYCMQVTCTLDGALDIDAFENAWRDVMQRHAALRTSFPIGHGRDGLQIVWRSAELPFHVEDWRLVREVERSTRLDTFRAEDRQRAFDLSRPPLFRLALLRVADERYECIWTYHHLILDGWSAYTVLKEVFATYSFLRGMSTDRPLPARPYSDYIAALGANDLAGAESFWRHSLRGFTKPTSLEPGDGSMGLASNGGGEQASGTYGEGRLSFTPEDSAALEQLARAHRLTMNSLAHGAWSLVLNHLDGSGDVMFGATVTGRPPELTGVESMVGVFINTLPVRVRIRHDMPLSEWLAGLQREQAERHPFEHTPLSKIQEWSELSGRRSLFESILVFENFPIDFSLHQRHGGLNISNVRSSIDEHYPIIVVVEPSPCLSIHIKYDRARLAPGTIAELLKGFESVLRSALADIHAPVQEVEADVRRTLAEDRGGVHRERQDSNRRKLSSMRGATRSQPLGEPTSQVSDGADDP